jgi:EAL domain-containing protein (putative c-di-GMP-specific phosphodiesterase class I)
MIDLARTLNLTVTGEGIETADQLERLREMGCTMGQGFVFAKPGPPSEVARLLAETLSNRPPLSA